MEHERPVFPRIDDLIIQGSKLTQALCMQSAAHSFGSRVPIVVYLETQQDVKEMFQRIVDEGEAGVIKWEFSEAGLHVFGPGLGSKEKLYKALKSDKKWEESHILQPKWFYQPYVDEIMKLGELRLVIVNGMLLRTVETTPVSLENGKPHP